MCGKIEHTIIKGVFALNGWTLVGNYANAVLKMAV